MHFWLFSLLSLALAQPLEGAWVPVLQGGASLEDSEGDGADVELVGSVEWQADDTSLWLGLDLSGPLGGHTVAVLWQGAEGLVGIWSVDEAGAAAWEGSNEDPLNVDLWAGSDLSVEQVEPLKGTGEPGLALGVDRAEMGTSWGVTSTTPIQVMVVVGQDGEWSDWAGCDGACSSEEAYSDVWRVDEDEDARTLSEETLDGTDPADADSDDDGLMDGEEGRQDTDKDGRLDALDCDADDDGLVDGLESSVLTPADATDLDAGCWVADADPATSTDPVAWDTDGGGLGDGQEDVDRDGVYEPPWETNPRDPDDDLDTDSDGIPDVVERAGQDGVVNDEDSDGDGLVDGVEGVMDTDGDGWPDFTDEDADGDGLLDGVEGTGDPDGDQLPNYQDLDSDGDGWTDSEEGDVDTDRDGDPDFVDTDSDGDRTPDAEEAPGDTDCDGLDDRVDADDESSFCDTGQPVPGVDTGAWAPPQRDTTPDLAGGWFGGGGCQSAPGTPWSLWWLALAALVRRGAAGGLLGLSLGGAQAAHARDVNVDRPTPTPGGQWLAAADPFAPGAPVGTDLRFDLADDLVTYRAPSGDALPVLDRVATTRLHGYARVSPGLGLGVALPWHQTVEGQGTGDLVLHVTTGVALADGWRAGLHGIGTLPTGGLAWLGAGRPTMEGRAVGGAELPWGRVAASSGIRSGTGARIGAQTQGVALTWSGAAAIDATSALTFTWELAGQHGLDGVRGGAPAETLVGLEGRWGVLRMQMAGGKGLGGGLGAPDWRGVALLGVGAWATEQAPGER